jgi:H+/gluconate symporter-like permease
MFARIGAKAVLLVIALAAVFFGIGLLALSIAVALAPLVGQAWGDAIAGAILVAPPLLWALIVSLSAPPPRRPAVSSGVLGALFGAVARETPWLAVVGAGLAGAAEMFLKRNKSGK